MYACRLLRKRGTVPHANNSTPQNYYLENRKCGESENLRRLARAESATLWGELCFPDNPNPTELE